MQFSESFNLPGMILRVEISERHVRDDKNAEPNLVGHVIELTPILQKLSLFVDGSRVISDGEVRDSIRKMIAEPIADAMIEAVGKLSKETPRPSVQERGSSIYDREGSGTYSPGGTKFCD